MKWLLLPLVLYGLAAADLALRARRACAEGEKYMLWHSDPASKRGFYEALLARRKSELLAERESGLGEAQYRRKLALAEVEKEHAVSESSLKFAVRWFETCADLFSPPENPWVRRCRRRLEEARVQWDRELRSAKVPEPRPR